jgi:hypothetical protein
MLDERSERLLAEVRGELHSILGGRLLALALYGSAASGHYVSGLSDLNLVAVVDHLDHGVLAAVRPRVERWRRRGVATPLVLDPRFLARAADVFPIELGDIRAAHRVLHGEDLFAGLRIDAEQLRRQCEREARGKLQRLRELYLEIGRRRRALRALMTDSVKTFVIVMRSVSRLAALPESPTCETLVASFCEAFRCELPVLLRLLETRLGRRRWEGDEEETFRAYLEEVGRLVALIDGLPPGGRSAGADR